MHRKTRVGVLFGGKSAEHEVSLQSAKNIMEAIDKTKYEVIPIAIDKGGQWFLNEAATRLLPTPTGAESGGASDRDRVALIPEGKGELVRPHTTESVGVLDVVFPILHGPLGEDGTVQGLLKLADVPFVGAGVLGSAVGMDKDVMKRLLRDGGIDSPDFVVLHRHACKLNDFGAIQKRLGLPVFVKPANMGSSVGISKVENGEQFEQAVREAFQFDAKVLVEAYGAHREIECSVLGNEEPVASVAGEVLPNADFYSYEAKYLDENGAVLKIPADLSDTQVREVQDLAVRTFQTLCCEGMARVDLFMKEDGSLLVNEINTIPGFTRISMYPKLWEASGVPYSELIDRLIQLAQERHTRDQALSTSYEG